MTNEKAPPVWTVNDIPRSKLRPICRALLDDKGRDFHNLRTLIHELESAQQFGRERRTGTGPEISESLIDRTEAQITLGAIYRYLVNGLGIEPGMLSSITRIREGMVDLERGTTPPIFRRGTAKRGRPQKPINLARKRAQIIAYYETIKIRGPMSKEAAARDAAKLAASEGITFGVKNAGPQWKALAKYAEEIITADALKSAHNKSRKVEQPTDELVARYYRRAYEDLRDARTKQQAEAMTRAFVRI